MRQRLGYYAKLTVRTLLPFMRMSRLGYTIVLSNIASILLLIGGLLYFNQFREGLVSARLESLKTQSEIIAGALAANASLDRGDLQIDPDLLLKNKENDDQIEFQDPLSVLDFPINPEKIAPLLRRLLSGSEVRARIYGPDSLILLDSEKLFSKPDIVVMKKPDKKEDKKVGLSDKIENWFKWKVFYRDYPLYKDDKTGNGSAYNEIAIAQQGSVMPMVRIDQHANHVLSVAAPIKRQSKALGVLLLSSKGGVIQETIRNDRRRIMHLALSVLVLAFLSSVFLAHYIGRPMYHLASAANRVRKSIKAREKIPDFTHRNDEIGDLSGSLREMTAALYSHLDANENFAADVAHELDTPLTSLKAGIEAMKLLKVDDPRREEFEAMIMRDIARLSRLIKDISDASRLDAELAMVDSEPVDIAALLQDVVNIIADTHSDNQVALNLELPKIQGKQANSKAYIVEGHPQRIGQVFTNILKNAISFSSPQSSVAISLERNNGKLHIQIEDEGPGIPPEALEKIFERFYTDRPDAQGFGKNSGLGLNISRQIMKAHRGRIWAENIHDPSQTQDQKTGARFHIEFPVKYNRL